MDIKDFLPGQWQQKFDLNAGHSTHHVRDYSTKQIWNKKSKHDKLSTGITCFKYSLYTPITQTIKGVIAIAIHLFRVLSFYNFRHNKPKEALIETGYNLLRIVAQPASIAALELATIYGWFRPYDGRKLYASIERLQYPYEFLHTEEMQPIKTNTVVTFKSQKIKPD